MQYKPQANGHISRAIELLPHLQLYGEVDIFLSGANSSLVLDAPVKYRSNGLSLFYNCTGGLDYWKIMKGYQPFKLRKEIQELPVEEYDLVINDFDYITSASCIKKKIPSVQFGHQGSFQSTKTPRPENKSTVGEWVLKNYAKATYHIGLHFEKYDEFIFHPVIKKEILEAEPTDKNYITVYLPSYCEPQLEDIFHPFKDFNFKYSQRKPLRKKGRLISVFYRLTDPYSIRAWYTAQVLLPVVVLKLRLKRFILERKLSLFQFVGNMSKFVTQQL
jgi:uncharacterized protein (TIGR00661 family)